MIESQSNQRLNEIRPIAAAARRRALLVQWEERCEWLLAVRPHSEGERQAQRQALALMEKARPEVGCCGSGPEV